MCAQFRQHDNGKNLLTLTKVSRSHGHTTQTLRANQFLTKAALLETPGSSSRLLRVPRSARLLVLCFPERGGWRNYSARFVFFFVVRRFWCLSSTDSFSYFSSLPQVVRGAASMCFRGGGVAGSWAYTCFVSRRLATGVVQPAPELKIVRPLQPVSSSLSARLRTNLPSGGRWERLPSN